MDSVRVAVIGAGAMAREHIRAFGALEGVEVAGIHSRTRSRAELLAEEFSVPTVADGVVELRERTAAELVVVAVPELAAAAVAGECLAHDWAMLMEKPAGCDHDEARGIAAAAARHARPVMVAFNRRFYSSVRAVLDDVDTREETRWVHVQDQQSYVEARRHNHPEHVVERFMYANSIHVIDMIRTFCRGEIVSVTPIMPWQGERTEVVLGHVRFSSGDAALYEGLWQGPGPWACSVSTPSRRWTLQPLERASFQNQGERVQNAVEPAPEDSEFKAGFKRQAEAVVARVRGEPSAAIDINESLHTMRLINQLFGV